VGAPGDEFFFMEATTVVFDTGMRISIPVNSRAPSGAMTGGSVYFHFLEARRRPPFGKDDFTVWLLENDDGEKNRPYIEALARIDFYFTPLSTSGGNSSTSSRPWRVRNERTPGRL